MNGDNKAWVIIVCVLAVVIGVSVTTCVVVDRHADVRAAELGICWVASVGTEAKHMERCK